MSERKGSISVNTTDIFPIIKKWLYSEHDIFLRELIANATDAITKRATMARSHNLDAPAGKILISLNKTNKTITISDNGIGMSEAEVEKYIAQLAFSGAEEFVKKMKDQGKDAPNDIIGKFGLGFYSSFMVADKVELETLSMQEGSSATKWTCLGDIDYTFSPSSKSEVGTTITMHINQESQDFLDFYKLNEVLKRYCDFLPYEIGLLDEEKKTYPRKEDGSEDKTKEPLANTPTIINDTTPLWKRDPKELKDEDYINFYKKQYPMDAAPLFWIHLRVDHPFTLEGILYFPKLNPNRPFKESNIKLYCKQVFVSDNVTNIIPEFLSLLKGCIDSSDIPLNVSRSSLQGDPNIRRISNYVVKKVAEALKKLFQTDRAKYEQIWNDSGMFIKYGCISDNRFDELMREYIIFKNSQDKFMTLKELRDSIPEALREKMGDKVIYFEKGKSDASLRSQLWAEGIHCIETDDHIDPHFMQHIEVHALNEVKYQFTSVGAEIANILGTESVTDGDMKIKELFHAALTKKDEVKPATESEAKQNERDVAVEKLRNALSPAYYRVDEQMKRFGQMTAHMGNQMFPVKRTLVVNPNNPLIQNALKIHEKGGHEDLVQKICLHVEDLANISSEGLKQDDRELFVRRSQELIQDLTNFAL